ncbi:MAG: hypothetical protein HN366_18435 [Deltaproteobacteria bacterium]|jgi:hypothetical protein|nr:hypothetical protein [Deltaproteobacteria bacterium]MBT6499741.1 hypothetical protein [Deltaproteobacteria bacterium]
MIPSEIQKWVDAVEPREAALTLAGVLSRLFPLLEEETRLELVSNLIGTPSDEKLTSLVHL